ncbi:GT-D fold domain-containing glycosyltransferase [Lachnospiraceae bacterium 45-W7]
MEERVKELKERISCLEGQIVKLQEENLSNKKDNAALLQAIRELYEINRQMMLQLSNVVKDQSTIDMNLGVVRGNSENMPFELLDPRLKREEYCFPNIRSAEETIEEIIRNKKSMARFGDGEFSQIIKLDRHKFQKLDERLGSRLKEVLYSRHPRMLIAIANNYGSLQDFTESAANAIRIYMTNGGTRKQHMELLEPDRVYYDAYVSRPYVMYKDWRTNAPGKRFEHIRDIWKDRRVIIVEGAQTRMGVFNDLLDGARDIKRILAPATNSFDRYDDILKSALESASEDILFLIAMGPAAGVLAYDLTAEGYQALDIGHLDLEYEWFLAGEGKRLPVPYKYNNEVEGDDTAEELHDPLYEGQIIADLQ